MYDCRGIWRNSMLPSSCSFHRSPPRSFYCLLSSWPVFSGTARAREVARGVDQRLMRKRLRKISNQPFVFGVVLFREETNVIAEVEEPFEYFMSLVELALKRIVVGQPKC